MVTFYHVSTNKIKTGDTIKRTMTPAKWRIDRGYTKDFACLAFNINHAKFWVKVLSQSPKENGSWYIYKVQIPAEEKVELCIDGLYYNFAIGIEGTAEDVKSLDVVPYDSEVIVTSDNARVIEIEEANKYVFSL